ncbi:MAG: methionine synthase, partial [Sporomusaceae bacterium]|nr:methionine synthase [Sporomusaceae bacterium]
CDKTSAFIARHAAQFGCVTGKRFSPGYGDFELTAQPDILRLANAQEIGLGVTASMMLIPRKSVTAIIGVYPYQPSLQLPIIEKSGCDVCRQPQCDARKESREK